MPEQFTVPEGRGKYSIAGIADDTVYIAVVDQKGNIVGADTFGNGKALWEATLQPGTISLDPGTYTLLYAYTNNCFLQKISDVDGFNLYLIGGLLDHIELQDPLTMRWINISQEIPDVLDGSSLNIRVVTDPSDAVLITGYPTWNNGLQNGKKEGFKTFAAATPGEFTVTATCGNTVSGKVRIVAVDHIEYKRSSEKDVVNHDGVTIPEDQFYAVDGGGVGGKILTGASFDYRVIFKPTQDDKPTPVGVRWQLVKAIPGGESVMQKGDGTKISASANAVGSCFVRLYVDTNNNDQFDKAGLTATKTENWSQSSTILVSSIRDVTCTIQCAPTLTPADVATDVDNKLSEANDALLTRNIPADYRALTKYTRSGAVTQYGASYPDSITSVSDYDALFAGFGKGVRSNIIYVKDNFMGYNGMTQYHRIVVARNVYATVGGTVHPVTFNGTAYAHEIGHCYNLNDASEELLVMRGANAPWCNILRKSDASTFEASLWIGL